MTSFALMLVLIAAVAHATWNLLAKRVCGGTAFIWLFGTLSAVIYLPLAIWITFTQHPYFGPQQLLFILGSAALHAVYFILLDKGYKVGDLSVIYPLARGTGPLLSTLAAIFLLGEHPTPIALAGAVLIGLGIIAITGNPLQMSGGHDYRPFLFAILCGMTIASYTVLDKVSVSTLLIPPLLLDWSSNLGRVLLLTPYAVKNWDKVRAEWATNKKAATGVAILSPLAYILVLTAMVFSPVSYIAPAREISILIGTVMGAKLLSEGNIKMRLIGATAMMAGLAALSSGY
jgi:drug/metabolite transporter (DMT)-like permease